MLMNRIRNIEKRVITFTYERYTKRIRVNEDITFGDLKDNLKMI
jgi:hypothetical protein